MKKVFVIALASLAVLLSVQFLTLKNAYASSISYIYVDVKGEVNNPGVYRLQENSRAFQAIELAGGLTNDAYTRDVNLAKKIFDEEVIYIPCFEEYDNSSSKININTASKEELELLNGIGSQTAQNIIDYRNANGGFKTIEEIKNVTNIKDAIYEKIKDYITI